jgi:hypothetical protein
MWRCGGVAVKITNDHELLQLVFLYTTLNTVLLV